MPHTCTLDFSKVIHYLDDECFSFVHTLTNPSFVGVGEFLDYGIIYCIRGCPKRPGGKHPTIQDKNIAILWFGVRRMKWKDFDSFFESNKLKSNPPPYYLVVHLGSNDLGILPDLELYQNIKCSFLRCKFLVPNMSIIWSDM